MASTDARPVPRKNTAYRVYFPIFDADGDLVSAAAGLDSEVSIDGAAFSDCTNEATEIGSSGMYYLDLTASEMNGDGIIVQVKTSTSGAKTSPIVLYPEETGDIRADVTVAAGGITAASLAADALTAAKVAADVGAEIATAVRTELATELARIDATISSRLASAGYTAPPSAASVADAVWDESTVGHTTSGTFGEQLKTDIDAILVDTAEIGAAGAGLTEAGGTGDHLTAVPWNASWDTEVQSEVQDAIEANHLDHLLAVDYDPASKPGTATALLNELVESDAGVSRFTANALEQAPSGSLTAAAIADAVWEEAIADHSGTSGSTAESLNAAGGAGDPWVTSLPGSYTGTQAGKILADILVDTGTTLQGELDGIQADTEDIQSRLPAALVSGRIDASVGAMASGVLTATAIDADAITAAKVAADVTTELQSGLATAAELAKVPKSDGTATWNATALASIQSEASDALTAYDPPTRTEATSDKDEVLTRLGTPAGVSVAADVADIEGKVDDLEGRLTATRAGYLDNLSGGAVALQASVDTLEASATAIEADTQDIQSRLPAALVGGRMDATVDSTGMESGAIDAILDDTIGDSTLTVRQALRVLVAGMAGKLSGAATTTVTIRNVADSANVIVATVDADGNRSAVTVTP